MNQPANCRFCGAGHTQIYQHTELALFERVVLSATLHHTCTGELAQPYDTITLKGENTGSVLARWQEMNH